MIVSGTALWAPWTLLFLTTTNPWWFVVFRVLEGLGAAAVVPAAQAQSEKSPATRTAVRPMAGLTTAQYGGLFSGPLRWLGQCTLSAVVTAYGL